MVNVRVVSLQELAQHNTSKDCWIAVHGVVMNITPFLNEHPGGPDVIVSVSGKDCTHDFEDVGHTDSARRSGDKYIIGRLEGYFEDSEDVRLPTNKDIAERKKNASGANGLGFSGSLVSVGATLAGLAALYYAFIANKQ
jgi:cytochrome b involved in lipid metabolism